MVQKLKTTFLYEASFVAWFKYAKTGSDVDLDDDDDDDDDEWFLWYGWPTKSF